MSRRRPIAAWSAAAVAVVSLLTFRYEGKVGRAPIEAVAERGCDLREGPCRARVPGGGELLFAIEPRTIPLLEPLTLTLAGDGIEPRRAEVEISGVNYDMGTLRAELIGGAGRPLSGSTSLSVCLQSEMRWRARVEAETSEGRVRAQFFFDTRYRPRWRVVGADGGDVLFDGGAK